MITFHKFHSDELKVLFMSKIFYDIDNSSRQHCVFPLISPPPLLLQKRKRKSKQETHLENEIVGTEDQRCTVLHIHLEILSWSKKSQKTYQYLRKSCSSVRFVLTYLAMLMDECSDRTARLDNHKVTSTPWSLLKRGPRIKRPSRKASASSNIAPNARRSTTGILVGYRGYVLRFLFV